MKKISIIVLLLTFYGFSYGQELKTQKDSLSYSLGLIIGTQIISDNLDIDSKVFAQAIDALKAEKPLFNLQDAQAFVGQYFQKKSEAVASENLNKGKVYQEQNKNSAGVVTLPSGLQYLIMKNGEGNKPNLEDRVKVHYTGKLIDGTVFDSSVQRGEPATFGLTQVIKGWTEILQLMPVGSKWKVTIPADLAYGLQAPPAIGPNQTLVFEIELLDIVKE